MSVKPLDREPVEALAEEFMRAIVTYYRTRLTARSTAQEVLNALGSSAAIIIHGTGSPESRDEARAFFDRAVDNQLMDLANSCGDEGR